MAYSHRTSSSLNCVRFGLWLGIGGLGVGALSAVACSSDFSSCTESRTCPRGGGSNAGEAGEAEEPAGGASGAAGNSGRGGSSEPGGGTAGQVVEAGSAGEDAAAGTAGTAGSAGISGSGGSAPVDTTPPQVTSIVPANGAKGIKSDAKIVVTFSEAVDKAAAEAALTTSAGAVSFSWNAEATVLTATPNGSLPYATVANATTFTVQVSTGLKDLANNHSSLAFNSSFSTLRELSLKISRAVIGTYTVSNYPSADVSAGDDSPLLGDGFDNKFYRAFPDFDITPVPTSLSTIVSATLSVPISLKNPTAGEVDWGAPFAGLGNLLVEHVFDSPIQQSSLTKPALSSVGTLMTAASASAGIKSIDVTDALKDDVVNRVARGNRSIYRLQFAKTTDNDAASDLVAIPFNGTMTMDVVYLAD